MDSDSRAMQAAGRPKHRPPAAILPRPSAHFWTQCSRSDRTGRARCCLQVRSQQDFVLREMETGRHQLKLELHAELLDQKKRHEQLDVVVLANQEHFDRLIGEVRGQINARVEQTRVEFGEQLEETVLLRLDEQLQVLANLPAIANRLPLMYAAAATAATPAATPATVADAERGRPAPRDLEMNGLLIATAPLQEAIIPLAEALAESEAKIAADLQVSRGLQLQSLWIIPNAAVS